MKYAILTIVIVALILWTGECKITWSPFSIALPAWRSPLAWALFVAAITLWGNHRHHEGVQRGVDISIEALEEIIEKDKAEQSKTENQ